MLHRQLKRIYIYAAILLVGFFPLWSSAEETPRLKIVTLVSPNDNPELFHFFKMVNAEICRLISYECSLSYVPAPRAALMVENGEADGENYRIFEFANYAENARHVRVNAALYEASFYVWGKIGVPRVNSWEEVIAVNREVIYIHGSKLVVGNLSPRMKGKLFYAHHVESGLKMLNADRASYFITSDVYNVEQKLHQLNLQHSIVKLGKIMSANTYMYMNEKHRTLIPRIERAIEYMKKNGTLERLKREMDKSSQNKLIPKK
jgi:polar amino acid transport system substrate-binding protein